MTPHKQLNQHLPAQGEWGDCYRTAIACLLNLRPEEVPHTGHEGNEHAVRDMNEWLREKYACVHVEFPLTNTLEEVLVMTARYFEGLHLTLLGTSRTGVNHVVIVKNGEIVHDPSPHEAGIVGPGSDGNYWAGFLGVLT